METGSPNSIGSAELAAAFQDFSTSTSLRNQGKTSSEPNENDDMCPMESPKSSRDRRRTKSLPVSSEQASLLARCAKRVQFADTLGLDLANVKHFNVTEDPHVPSQVFSRLRSYPPDEPQDSVDLCDAFSSSLKLYRLSPRFTMPIESDNFFARLWQSRVALEKVTITHFDVKGVIRVTDTNSTRKEVGVRHTFNNWLTCMDTKAVHESGKTHEGELWNQFEFTLHIPPYMNPDFSVQFAVYCLTDDGDYWDNNEGRNYVLRWDQT